MKQKLNQRGRTSHIALHTSQKGITLIALVITIIVLLILAGVTISMVLGDNGIIGQAQKAKKAQENADANGSDILDNMEATIMEQGKTGETLRSKITASNYGQEINYPINLDNDNNTNDWKIFNNNGINVWIIAKNYVNWNTATTNSLAWKDCATNAGMTTNNSYAWWENPSAEYTAETYANGKCAASLADTSKWTPFVDSDYATKAMGGPTIEMFAQGYNAKNPNGEKGIIKCKLVPKVNNKGYQVGWFINEPAKYADSISGLNTTSSADLFVITAISDSYGYWLASPSAYDPSCVMNVEHGGSVNISGFKDHSRRCSTSSLSEI